MNFSALALRRVRLVSAFTAKAVITQGPQTKRETLRIDVRRKGRAAAGGYWRDGFGRCYSRANPLSGTSPFEVNAPNFDSGPYWMAWRAWLFLYNTADGYYWSDPSPWAYWYYITPSGPYGGRGSLGQIRFHVPSGSDQYVIGAVETYIYENGAGDWNFVTTDAALAYGSYGQWCWFP